MKGVYVLMITVNKNIKERIGSLGEINFEKSVYAYTGSAQNNLRKRVERHLSDNKKMHWHIDYLLNNESAQVDNVFYKEASKSEECNMARQLNSTESPVMNFGCSDCNCNSHLFKIKNQNSILKLGVKRL